ncbi:MAG: hypothetical protein CMF23_13855 [Ignavibacteriae bacterium]|nr:hypothetical protein [Ignavibacteriota bacterium]
MEKKIGAIVTGGDFQGLGVIRSLGEKGIPIVLIDPEYCIAKYSRYVTKCFKGPSPFNEKEYIQYLINLIKKEKLYDWIIFPNSDQIVYVISKNKDVLSRFIKVPVPPIDTIKKVYDKKITYKTCAINNIPIPKTYFSKSITEILDYEFNYPIVLKPSIRDHFYSKVKKKAYRINNQDELKSVYNEVNKIIDSEEILIQELIDGGPKNLYSFCPYFKDGKVIASVTARRSRQHPMDFGHATTFAEVVELPILEELAVKFLSIINYQGICEVEFMYDEKTEQFKLIEVNPRVWGWHTLAIASGADLPYLLFLDETGKKLPDIKTKKQMKWIRLTTDSVTVIKEIFHRRLKITDYIKSLRGKKEFAVFSLKDPLPFFIELIIIPYLWKKRGF